MGVNKVDRKKTDVLGEAIMTGDKIPYNIEVLVMETIMFYEW